MLWNKRRQDSGFCPLCKRQFSPRMAGKTLVAPTKRAVFSQMASLYGVGT